MALEKVVEVDQIEVKGEFSIQVRTATKVLDNGKQIGSVGYHRHVVHPDSILEGQDARVVRLLKHCLMMIVKKHGLYLKTAIQVVNQQIVGVKHSYKHIAVSIA